MIKYIMQRIGFMLITLIIIATFTFFLMKIIPGSPFNNAAKMTEVQREILYEKYGLNEPLPVQYAEYMMNLVKGDLGVSFQYNKKNRKRLLCFGILNRLSYNRLN